MILKNNLARYVDEARRNYRSLIPIAGEPDPVDEVRMFSIPARAPDRDIPVKVYWPRGAERARLPIVVFAHGGGFISGDFDTHDVLLRALSNRAGALVVAVGWRLAPEHPFPAGLEDVYAALEWMADHGGELGGDTSRIALAGDSAGGNLAAAAAILARDRSGPRITAQLLLYPLVEWSADDPSWHKYGDTFPKRVDIPYITAAYLPPGTDLRHPLVAPLFAKHRGLPAAFIAVGDLDPLREGCRAYAAALVDAGVPAECIVYPGDDHGFVQFFKDKASHPNGEAALSDAVTFLLEAFA